MVDCHSVPLVFGLLVHFRLDVEVRICFLASVTRNELVVLVLDTPAVRKHNKASTSAVVLDVHTMDKRMCVWELMRQYIYLNGYQMFEQAVK